MNTVTKIDIFQEVKDKLDIVGVIGEHLPLDNHLKTKCPWHDDHTPSFSVDKEKQRFRCFGCNVSGDIFNFYEKYFNISRGEGLKRLADKAGVALDNGKAEIVVTYEYKDENGETLYYIDRVIRNGKKFFPGWHKKDGNRINDLKGVKRVLYRLPELIKGTDPVIIVEGEKDVETARSLGFTATTNPHGAGNWKDDYSLYLKGRDCVLIPDNHKQGWDHMDKVAESLLKNGIKFIKIVNLPGLKEKEDLTDYMDNGGTKEELLRLIEETPVKDIANHKLRNEQGIILHEIVEDELKFVHPALDFIDDTCYITLPLLTKSVVDVRKEKQETEIKNMYWIITSKKEMFPLTKTREELFNRNLYFSGEIYISGNRWNRKNGIYPWLNGDISINPVDIFNRVKQQFEHYLDFIDKRYYTYFSLWTIGTYFFPLFPAFPIMFLNGGSGSGKSKTISIISALAFNAINTVNISDPAIFRLVQGTRGTQLLDENEKIANPANAPEMINLILAGFLKGSKAVRLEKTRGDKFTPVEFEVHCPKVIANIKGINLEALLNRTVPFLMHPAKKEDSRAKLYPDPNDTKWQGLRNGLYMLLMNHWQEIKETRKEISPIIPNGEEEYTLGNYFYMQWEPILTLAKYISNKSGDDLVYCDMAVLAVEKMEERKRDKAETYDNILLRTILKMTNNPDPWAERALEGRIFLANEKIYNLYKEELGVTVEWLNPSKLGWMIKKLGIGEKARINHNLVRGIWISVCQLNEICQRHGVELENEEN